MEGISIRPKRAEIKANVIALGILCGLSLGSPMFGLICVLLVPLFACPLVKHREEWLGWAAAAAPCIGWLVGGWDPAVAVALLLPGAVPQWVTRRLEPKARIGIKGVLLYTSLSAVCMAAVIGVMSIRMGAPLARVLPDMAADWLRQQARPEMLLTQLAQAGWVTLPDGYQPNALTSAIKSLYAREQMVLSFRRTVELFSIHQLPMLVIHACLLSGVFTSLRIEHLNGVMLVVEVDPLHPGERKTHVTSPPGFRLMAFPRKVCMTMMALMLLCSVVIEGQGLAYMLSLMGYQLASTFFQLIGAAVMVFVFDRKHPDHLTAVGVAVGLIYALMPMVPCLIGLSDCFVHYRTRKVREDQQI